MRRQSSRLDYTVAVNTQESRSYSGCIAVLSATRSEWLIPYGMREQTLDSPITHSVRPCKGKARLVRRDSHGIALVELPCATYSMYDVSTCTPSTGLRTVMMQDVFRIGWWVLHT